MADSYTVIVEEDNKSGDLYITFPQNVIEQLGWDENTDLKWIQLDNDRWSIQKID